MRGSVHPPERMERARALFAELRSIDRVAEALVAEGMRVPRGTLYTWLYRIEQTRAKRKRVETAAEANERPEAAREKVDQGGDDGAHWTLNAQSERITNVDELLAHCKVDRGMWSVAKWNVGSYEVTISPKAEGSDAAGWSRVSAKPVTVTMFKVSVTLERKVAECLARAAAAVAAEAFARVPAAVFPAVIVAQPKTGLLYEPSIVDHHFNKLVWGREVADRDYDLRIATGLWREATEVLYARSAHQRFERVILPVGHDLFNADNLEGSTTKGTRQDNDTRTLKVFDVVLNELIWSTEFHLTNVGPVEWVLVPGNHDELLSALVAKALKHRYHGHPHVTVDDGPALTKYRQWGWSMLGFNHGDKSVTADKLVGLMATDPVALPMWATTRFREIHTGHKHIEIVSEVRGVKVRSLPSLTATDAWHAANGYRNGLRQAQAFHWSTNDGLVGQAVYTHAA